MSKKEKLFEIDSHDLLKLGLAAGVAYATKKILDIRKRNKYRPGAKDDDEREWKDYQDSIS